MSLKEFSKSIYYRNILIENAEKKQGKFNAVLNALKKKNSPKNLEYIYKKRNLLDNVKKFYDGRDMINDAFKDKIFVHYREGRFEGKDEDEDEIKDENGLINYQMRDRLSFLKKRDINDELVRKNF